MSLDLASAALERPIQSTDELVAWIRSGEKPASRWRVGVEYEKIGVAADGGPVPYEGPGGIRALLTELAARDPGARLHEEDGNPIAYFSGEYASVSLEPGGQLELSGTPVRSIADAAREVLAHQEALTAASRPHGLRWLALGYRPWGTTAEMPWMPKLRYQQMRSTLGQRGRLALDMMLMTATVQANLDFAGEADLASKVRTATAVSPLVSALFANSPVVRGEPSADVDFRYTVWRETDPARCGLLEGMLRDDFGYRTYVDWALDVPLLFARAGGRYVSGGGQTFLSWLTTGRLGGEPLQPTLTNFTDHLTTLFPEVRVKKVIELRGADSVPPPLLFALPAIWVGLLYEPLARRDAWRLTSSWTFDERLRFQAEVARSALAAPLPRGEGTALDLVRELLAIAQRGLLAWSAESGVDERPFLEPALELAASGTTRANRLLAAWERSNRSAASIVAEALVAG